MKETTAKKKRYNQTRRSVIKLQADDLISFSLLDIGFRLRKIRWEKRSTYRLSQKKKQQQQKEKQIRAHTQTHIT